MSLHRLTVSQARIGLLNKDFSCREYIEALLAWSDKHRIVNAWVHENPEHLREQACLLDQSGKLFDATLPLAGIPIAVKDNIDVADLPCSAGTGALQGRIPAESAGVVSALVEAGALVAGKTGMHELAMGITSNNTLTGAVRNPYDPERFAGGSSGGSAAAVAAGFVPCALGTETGGSVRLPAALCGLAGFRPTSGRYSASGLIPLSQTCDTVGPMARSVDDLVLLDTLLSGDTIRCSASLDGLRLGLPRDSLLTNLDPRVAAVFEQVLQTLASNGVLFVEADISRLLELDAAIGFPLVLYELQRDLPVYIEKTWETISFEQIHTGIGSRDVSATIGAVMGRGRITEIEYQQSLQLRSELQTMCADYFRRHRLDAMIYPTTPLPAACIKDSDTVEHNGERVSTFAIFSRNCNPGSAAGLPGISLPMGMVDGLPVGLCLSSPWHTDRYLLHVALAMQEVLPSLPEPVLTVN